MRTVFLSGIAAVSLSAPAFATQGILCRTIEGPERVYSLGAGTHGAATWWIKERQGEEWLDREIGQHWIDDERLFVDLVECLEPYLEDNWDLTGADILN